MKRSDVRTRPLLFSWGARALFVGPSLRLSAHRNAVAVLALGLDARFTLTNAAGSTRARSALIEPNTLHQLCVGPSRMAFVYVDAASRDLEALRSAFSRPGRLASVGIRDEEVLVRALCALARGSATFARTRALLEARFLGALPATAPDPVGASLRFLHAHAADRPTLADLAREAGLSPSRYRHRFVALTGVPFRRYRTWIAMGASMRAIARRLAHDRGARGWLRLVVALLHRVPRHVRASALEARRRGAASRARLSGGYALGSRKSRATAA